MEALDKRCSTCGFSNKELPKQTLSDLLWAAWGINREGSDKRTAPSSNNKQEIDIYVVKANGIVFQCRVYSVEWVPVLCFRRIGYNGKRLG